MVRPVAGVKLGLNVAAAAHRFPERVKLELVGPTIREAAAYLREHYLPQGWFSVATFQEPGWRIEGKKSLGLELAEPAPGDTRWSRPDAVIYPTGGGTGVLGMWKAWDELEALGLIGAQRPRMLCVQSEAMAPLARAFDSGALDTTAQPGPGTIAFGLNVPACVAVSEVEIAAEFGREWRRTHGWRIPEGAACLAALPVLLECGMVKRGEWVVAVNTGSAEKYLPALRHLFPRGS